MLNAEKYKNEILEKSNVVFDFSISKDRHTIEKCLGVCDNCIFCNIGEHCSNVKVKWLLSEYKEPIKLSRLEYEILKLAINKSCEYIARDSDGQLYVFMEKPRKSESFWKTDGYYYLLEMFSVLFQFVQWEDSTSTLIKDVLENCEVVDDDQS